MFGNTDEDTGSSDMSGGPIGTDMFDVEDDIANFLGMRPDIEQEVNGEEDEDNEVPTERLEEGPEIDTEGSAYTTVELTAPFNYEGGGEDYAEVKVKADYKTTPHEYEGEHRSFTGGPEVTDIKIAQDFEFMGRHFKAGMDFPGGLLKFWEPDDSVKKAVSYDPRDKVSSFYRYVEYHIQDDVEVPSRHYKGQY